MGICGRLRYLLDSGEVRAHGYRGIHIHNAGMHEEFAASHGSDVASCCVTAALGSDQLYALTHHVRHRLAPTRAAHSSWGSRLSFHFVSMCARVNEHSDGPGANTPLIRVHAAAARGI